MNEQINNKDNNNSQEKKKINFQEIVKDIAKDYNGNDNTEIKLDISNEYIIYTKQDKKSRVMILKRKMIPIKDKEPMGIKEYIKKVIDEDLSTNGSLSN